MSNNPYESPQGQYAPQKPPYHPQQQQPNQTSLVLGIVSIIAGVIGIFPGCCCILLWAPMALVSIGTGVGGIMSADPREPVGKTLSIIGVSLGGMILFLHAVYFALMALDAIGPNQFPQIGNDF